MGPDVVRCVLPVFLTVVVGLAPVAAPARAQTPDGDEPSRWSLSGDLRLRLETDRDSRRSDGTLRDDRDRLRARLRLAVGVDLGRGTALGARLRTGSRDSQQSPHVTLHDFDGNPDGDRDILLDRWFVRREGERAWGWLGRNSLPFWTQNELFWDDDVTPAGLALGTGGTAGESDRLRWWLTGAALAPPDGAVDFHGRLVGGQGRIETTTGSPVGPVRWTVASGLYVVGGEPGAEHLRNGNGARDYRLWVTSVQAADLDVLGRPLVLGVDLFRNLEDYSPTADLRRDPFAERHHDQTEGHAVSVRWGDVRERGDWSVAYTFARIEALAVHASYAQDDFVRWGSATQTDSSDFRGHELHLVYALRPHLRLTLRAFTAEALTSPQDGDRVRFDVDVRF